MTGRLEVRPAAELGPIIVCLDTSGHSLHTLAAVQFTTFTDFVLYTSMSLQVAESWVVEFHLNNYNKIATVLQDWVTDLSTHIYNSV